MLTQNKEKCAIIAIIGPTNAGKSSLINCLIGKKISIVTHKVQTTRSIIRGIVNHNNSQLIFIDTPGIFIPKRNLEKIMNKTARKSFSGNDITMLMLDANKGITQNVKNIADRISSPTIAVLNKIDLVKKPKLLSLSAQLNSLFPFDKTFMISALKNDGVNDLKDFLAKISPECPWMYSENKITDAPQKFILSEITREKLFFRIHQELPYQSIVETEMVKEDSNEIVIYQIIYVISENHKRIINGKNKLTLASITKEASDEMEKELKKKVLLNLFVKIKKEWVSNEKIVSNMGY
ncbi:MAG: GTPase Era [Rickettsiaceae bacterium H1]|nr:GTPase Era [Rickettsiaceae bacterium H1]